MTLNRSRPKSLVFSDLFPEFLFIYFPGVLVLRYIGIYVYLSGKHNMRGTGPGYFFFGRGTHPVARWEGISHGCSGSGATRAISDGARRI